MRARNKRRSNGARPSGNNDRVAISRNGDGDASINAKEMLPVELNKNEGPAADMQSKGLNDEADPDSLSTEDLNASLATIIPVLYGALLSYALYDLAVMAQKFLGDFQNSGFSIAAQKYAPLLLVFWCLVTSIMEDFGEITKLAVGFKYKRVARYVYEVAICCFFVMALAFVDSGKAVVSLFIYVLALSAGAIWSNQFKQEYKNHKSGVGMMLATQRNLQLLGAGIFTIVVGWILYETKTLELAIKPAIWFFAAYFVWQFFYVLYMSWRYGDLAGKYSVNIAIPDRLLRLF